MRTFFAAVAGLMLASCSDTPATTPGVDGGTDGVADGGTDGSAQIADWKAGTRLRPIVITGGSVKRFTRFHDASLNVDCEFQTLTDGQRRCAPGNAETTYFSDAACTQMVFGDGTCPPAVAPKYVQSMDYNAGCTQPDVYELGAITTPATVYEKQGALCAASGAPPQTYRSVTRKVPPAELVAATLSRSPRGKQLFATFLDGEDGSRQPFGMEDGTAPHAGPCDAFRAADGEVRCLPTLVAFVETYYSDATCTVPAAFKPGYVPDTCKLAPVAVQATSPSACGGSQNVTFFDVGAKVPGQIYEKQPTCVPASISGALGASFYLAGAPIADAAFAKLARTPGTQTPLTLEALVVDSGETVSVARFVDLVHKDTCTSSIAGDGKRRCVLDAVPALFADAACKTPIVQGGYHPKTCAAPAPPAFAEWRELAAVACTLGTSHILTVGAPIPVPAQAFLLSGAVCQPTSPAADYDYYATTTEIAPSEMVELAEVTE